MYIAFGNTTELDHYIFQKHRRETLEAHGRPEGAATVGGAFTPQLVGSQSVHVQTVRILGGDPPPWGTDRSI